MFKSALSAITSLFAGTDSQPEPVNFSWRLIHRKSTPFLLLPEHSGPSADNLELYSAQRPLAKLSRSLLPLLLRTPAAKLFDRVTIAADANSPFMRFLARQAGVSAGQMRAPAIKFGGVEGKTSRLVLLLRDAGGHPIRVVKVGLNPHGRAATEREADLLSRLPVGVAGCTGITGRFCSDTVSAFATAFFSGSSLDNDVGIEILFHAWLNDAPHEAIENLASWRQLESVASSGLAEWPALRDALLGHNVRPTLFHGDFAPWNVRMTNLENIRAFDWENGHLKGIPGWDWFHFIVQTSILVKRHSLERVAAELEQLVRSPRFQNYAQSAGISQIVEPLLLAYLLHQTMVIQPMEGRRHTERLFHLLWRQWQFKGNAGQSVGRQSVRQSLSPRQQLKSAFARVANLFWEPHLSPARRPVLSAQFQQHWLVLLVAVVWIGGVAALNFRSDPHLILAPFYLVPCIWLALRADRRLGILAALAAGAAGPLVQHLQDPKSIPADVTGWNLLMRAFLFYLMVVLLDNVRKLSRWRPQAQPTAEPNAVESMAGNWAVVLITSLYLALLVVLDVLTNPYYLFLPLYMLPCIAFTLTLNWRWGTLAAVIAAAAGPLAQRFEDPGYQSWSVEFWNTLMRLVIFQMVVLLLDRLRQESILFRDLKTD